MTRTEIKKEIKKALEKGFVCTDCCIGKTQYPILFAEPKVDGGYVDWMFNPEATFFENCHWIEGLDNSHWLEGFFVDEPLPTVTLTYKQICYRLKLNNPILHFFKEIFVTSNNTLKEMLTRGKTLLTKKENNPFTTLEWDEDDIF